MNRIRDFLTKNWWVGAAALVAGLVGLFAAIVFGQEIKPPPQETPESVLSGWGATVMVIAVLLLVAGVQIGRAHV